MSFRRSQSFDDIAENLSEAIDAVLQERSRDRRLALIKRQIRHGMTLGFKEGLRRAAVSGHAAEGVGDR